MEVAEIQDDKVMFKIRLLEDCFWYTKGRTFIARLGTVLHSENFVYEIEVDEERYPISSDKPTTLAFPSNVVEILDVM